MSTSTRHKRASSKHFDKTLPHPPAIPSVPTPNLHSTPESPESQLGPLLKAYKPCIEWIRLAAKDALNKHPPAPSSLAYDDVFILRFLLSRKCTKEAARSVAEAVKFRDENRAWIEQSATGQPHKDYETMLRFVKMGIHKPTCFGEPVFLARPGHGDIKGLMKAVGPEDLLGLLNYQKEVGFQLCDKLTRERGTIVKCIIVFDLDGMSLFKMDTGYFRCLGASSKIAEKIYPQLQCMAVVVHPPAVFRAILKIVNAFASKAFMEKQTTCPNVKTLADVADLRKCPVASKRFIPEDTPDYLGGHDKSEAASQ